MSAVTICATALFAFSLFVPVADAREFAQLDLVVLGALALPPILPKRDAVPFAVGLSAVALLSLRALTKMFFVAPITVGHLFATWVRH